jgi:hypothetical protein
MMWIGPLQLGLAEVAQSAAALLLVAALLWAGSRV